MVDKARNALRTSDHESAKPDWVHIGERLESVRASRTQPEMAAALGVSKSTYGRLERGVREIGADTLRRLARDGVDIGWLLTGEVAYARSGVSDQRAHYESHPLSDDSLTIALELADRCVGDGWLPRPLYAKLMRLMYEGITQGLPVADVLQHGRRAAQALAQGDTADGGESAVGETGRGRAG